jgi:hypothetical protein
MTEDKFWQMIGEARSRGEVIQQLGASLCALEPPEIISFNNRLSRKIADAGTFPVLAACFVIQSYVSDDTFRSFRAWLVSQGRDRYAAAIDDPETIADWLDEKDAEEIDGDPMLTAAFNAYQARRCVEEFCDQATVVPDLPVEQVWPQTKEEYQRRFPRLVDKFWNQQRINEFHSD